MATKKIKGMQIRGMKGSTNWNQLENMTDQDVRSRINSDSNTRELKDAELRKAQLNRKKI